MKAMIYKTYYASPLGDIALESDGKVLTGFRFEYQGQDDGRGPGREEGLGEDWDEGPFSTPV